MIRQALAVALADFRERSRTPKLLVVGILTAYLGKVIAIDSELVVAGSYTGVGTAAWYGAMVASAGTFVLFLAGFALVRGGIQRDRDTNVAEFLGTSPLSNVAYLFGKFLSNVAVLAVVTAILAAATVAAFLVDGVGGLTLWDLLSPFLLITLPAMTVVAAVAVFAETTRLLRGTLGSILYVFGAIFTFIAAGLSPDIPFDPAGISLLMESMAADLVAQHAEVTRPIEGFAYGSVGESVTPFRWSGVTWTVDRLLERSVLLVVAGGVLLVSTLTFDRFDSSAGISLPLPSVSLSSLGSEDVDEDGVTEGDTLLPTDATGTTHSADSVEISLPSVEHGGFAFGTALTAELRMALRRSRWWYVAVLGVLAGTAVAPLDTVRGFVLPVGFLLGLTVWSSLGTRERRHRTEQLVFTTASPVKLLAPTYVSGVVVATVLVLPAAVRYGLAGETGALLGLAGAAAVVPATALASGVWTARPRIFETIFLVAWYVGPMNGVVPLDFLAVSTETVAAGVPLACLALSPVLVGVAAIRRMRV